MLDGYDACLAALVEQDPRAADAEVLACSSAGGGLRIAVVGNEELVTAEAGRRVALSSGGKVVDVVAAAGRRPATPCGAACETDPAGRGAADRRHRRRQRRGAARRAPGRWSPRGWRGPVVVAGQRRGPARGRGGAGGVPHVLADNVVPRIGVLAPDSARAAIREMFLAHVIGGKHLSARARTSPAMVRGATPDVVLTGVELLARGVGDVVVVDVGGATTDVHSVVELDPDSVGAARWSPPRRSPAPSRATSACAGRR